MGKRSRNQDIADHFDGGIDCCAPRRDAEQRPGIQLAKMLQKGVIGAHVAGRSILELGCGRGEFVSDLVGAGATRGTGIDLSAKAIELAQRAATEDGLADRLSFRVGDAAVDALTAHDVVVHHRVICCYPDADAFLHNTIAVARSVYAFSMPRSRGLVGLFARIGFFFENLSRAFKRSGFRAYIHDERWVDATLTEAGFRRVSRADRRGWFIAVYTR